MADGGATCPGARWLSIIGIGDDGIDGLSTSARTLIGSAELVLGGKRHLELADTLISGARLSWPSPISDVLPEIEKHRGRPVAVLATGDPFFYGVGDMLMRAFHVDEVMSLPQPSAFALAASRLGWSQQDVSLVSLHGRALEGVIRYLQPGARILALSWDGTTASKLAQLLCNRGLGAAIITVLEHLGGPRQRVRKAPASSFGIGDIAALNTIAVEIGVAVGAMIVPLASGLDDSLFEHDGQLTKREVRAVTLSALAPRQGELLWDIGLGAGSVAIEWMLRHPSMKSIGIEADPVRAARAARNAAALGAPDLKIVQGRAPDALRGLSTPDAIFIGGGLSKPEVFEDAWSALKPGGRLVANAVSLASEARLIDLFQHYGGELVKLEVARSGRAGGTGGKVFVWRPAAPIIQWRITKT